MNLKQGEALQCFNTLALQARAHAFASISSEDQLLAGLAQARALNLPVVALGEGSNIVLAGDVNALVLKQQTRGIDVLAQAGDSITLRVAAGESWHNLVRWTLEHEYFGLENLALIPGTAGAAPIQNIGAYGVELRASLQRVHARKIVDDQCVTLTNDDCEFGYRDSVFKHRLKDQLVITAIELQLSRRPQVNITYPALSQYFEERSQIEVTPQAVFDAVVSIRRSKLPDPAIVPNAGSFFKNPEIDADTAAALCRDFPALPAFPQRNGSVKLSAAWMIDHCGWKGYRRNKVGVHAQHALVLVNFGSDSGAELLAFAGDIAASVARTFGVQLEIEPRVYGAGV